mmetsp:Transcript_28361/g.42956  ORF Transcript_28361/g.42956 Transcript_28361/m.42956 type:complete len:92 (+) Transcript_28361:292-567(+)
MLLKHKLDLLSLSKSSNTRPSNEIERAASIELGDEIITRRQKTHRESSTSLINQIYKPTVKAIEIHEEDSSSSPRNPPEESNYLLGAEEDC